MARWTRAEIGGVPGWIVITLGLVFNGVLLLVGLLTIGLHEASGEVLPRFFTPGEEGPEAGTESKKASGLRAWFRPHRKRRQLMALIITDRTQEVADRVLKDMHRGVTALPGKGMYTGKEHSVLMCALTVTEVGYLKSLVNSTDPHAFVIVSPVQEVLGGGFSPLKAP